MKLVDDGVQAGRGGYEELSTSCDGQPRIGETATTSVVPAGVFPRPYSSRRRIGSNGSTTLTPAYFPTASGEVGGGQCRAGRTTGADAAVLSWCSDEATAAGDEDAGVGRGHEQRSVWAGVADAHLPTHKLIVHLPGGRTAEANREEVQGEELGGRNLVQNCVLPQEVVEGSHCVAGRPGSGSDSSGQRSSSSLGELAPAEAAEAFVLSALAGDTPEQSSSEQDAGTRVEAPGPSNRPPTLSLTGGAGAAAPAPAANPFLAARETHDTLGGLIHAREVFRRRVARYAGVDSTSSTKVMKLNDRGDLFIGDVVDRRPHGEGVMLLYSVAPPPPADAERDAPQNPVGKRPRIVTQHIGVFSAGRAHGSGTCLKSDGSVFVGNFESNKRVGEFTALDAKGQVWSEKYNPESGKKVARKRAPRGAAAPVGTSGAVPPAAPVGTSGAEDVGPDPPPPVPAERCATCSQLFHALYNHSFGCRSHVANFVPDKFNLEIGIWSCCGARCATDPGCKFGKHVAVTTLV